MTSDPFERSAIETPQFGEREAGRDYVDRPSAYVWMRDGDGRVAAVRIEDGSYHLPGGGLHSGESAAEAAVREAWEECGIRAELGLIVGVADEFVHSVLEQTYFAKRSTFFLAEAIAFGEPSERGHELVWLEPDEARARLAPESHRWAIGRLAES